MSPCKTKAPAANRGFLWIRQVDLTTATGEVAGCSSYAFYNWLGVPVHAKTWGQFKSLYR